MTHSLRSSSEGVYHRSCFFSIPDPESNNIKIEKTFISIFCNNKFHKNSNYLVFWTCTVIVKSCSLFQNKKKVVSPIEPQQFRRWTLLHGSHSHTFVVVAPFCPLKSRTNVLMFQNNSLWEIFFILGTGNMWNIIYN